ncbi:hypothetical protein CNR22_04080 [Sphingobacteriaceae bacterium]|nr:hypothetical protein CNR22_04080 [Sphingobacteriaceae bacterium]
MTLKKSEPLKTVLTIVAGFLIMFLISHASWLVYVSFIVACAGLLSATLAKYIDLVWMGLAKVMGFIMPTLLLSLIFFFILFPLSLLSKLVKKKDPLLLSNTLPSTFTTVNKTFTSQSFEKPW